MKPTVQVELWKSWSGSLPKFSKPFPYRTVAKTTSAGGTFRESLLFRDRWKMSFLVCFVDDDHDTVLSLSASFLVACLLLLMNDEAIGTITLLGSDRSTQHRNPLDSTTGHYEAS